MSDLLSPNPTRQIATSDSGDNPENILELLTSIAMPTSDKREEFGRLDSKILRQLLPIIESRLALAANLSPSELSVILPSFNFHNIVLGEVAFYRKLSFLASRYKIIFLDFDNILSAKEFAFRAHSSIGSFRIFAGEILSKLSSQYTDLQFGICTSRSRASLDDYINKHRGLIFLREAINRSLIISKDDGATSRRRDSKASAIKTRIDELGLEQKKICLFDDLNYQSNQLVAVHQAKGYEKLPPWGRGLLSSVHRMQQLPDYTDDTINPLSSINGKSTHFLINFFNPSQVVEYIAGVDSCLQEIQASPPDLLIFPLRGTTPVKTLYDFLYSSSEQAGKNPKISYIPLGRVTLSSERGSYLPRNWRKEFPEERYQIQVESVFDHYLPVLDNKAIKLVFVDETAAGSVCRKNLSSLIHYLQYSERYADKTICLEVYPLVSQDHFKWLEENQEGKLKLHKFRGNFYGDRISGLVRDFNRVFGNVSVKISLREIPGIYMDNSSQLDTILIDPIIYQEILEVDTFTREQADKFTRALKIHQNKEASDNLKSLYLCSTFTHEQQQIFHRLLAAKLSADLLDSHAVDRLPEPELMLRFLENLAGKDSVIEVKPYYRREKALTFFERFFRSVSCLIKTI
jgi:hypothetical protein